MEKWWKHWVIESRAAFRIVASKLLPKIFPRTFSLERKNSNKITAAAAATTDYYIILAGIGLMCIYMENVVTWSAHSSLAAHVVLMFNFKLVLLWTDKFPIQMINYYLFFSRLICIFFYLVLVFFIFFILYIGMWLLMVVLLPLEQMLLPVFLLCKKDRFHFVAVVFSFLL